MVSHFAGDPLPVKIPRPDVYRVVTENKQHFWIFSKAMYVQCIHWYGNRSHECTKQTKKCNGCERNWPTKVKVYLDCFHVEANARIFLELTHTAATYLGGCAPHDATLRGLLVSVNKSKGGAKGRYQISIMEGRKKSSELPEERDPLPTLRFLWQCKNQHVQDSSASV